MNLAQLVSDFGARAGQPDLMLPPRGAASYAHPQGPVALEEVDGDLLIYTRVPAPFVPAPALLKILRATDLRRLPPQVPGVQVGARGQGAEQVLVLMIRLNWPGPSVQAIEDAVARLMQFRQEHADFGATA